MRRQFGIVLFSALIAASTHAQVQTEWWRVFPGPLGGLCAGNACAIDAAGNVYAAGRRGADFLIVKHSPAGVLLWTALKDFALGNDAAAACAVAPTGELYAFGEGGSGAYSGLVLMKFTSAGAWLWTRSLLGTASGGTVAGNMAFDAAGNVIVCGAIHRAGSDYDAAFASYSPSGVLNWTTQLDGGAARADVAQRLRVLPSGEIVAVGSATVTDNEDFAAWKLDSNGALLWTRTLDGGSNMFDRASSLAVSPAGKLLAGGMRSRGGILDWMLAQIDLAGGTVDWSVVHDQTGGNDMLAGVAVDASGVWWVTGSIESPNVGPSQVWWPTQIDALTQRYDAAGALLSSARWSGSTDYSRPSAILVGDAGQVWVAGAYLVDWTATYDGVKPFVLQYDAEGNLNWEHSPGQLGSSTDYTTDMQAGPDARLALVGVHMGSGVGSSDALFVTQLDLTHVAHAYCTAKTTSNGCVPRVSFVGTPSASASSGFVARASELRNQRNGVLFWSAGGAQAVPFGGGTLCVAPPLVRTPVQSSGGSAAPIDDCSGGYALDLNAYAHAVPAGAPLLVAGTSVHCQFWGRDPGFAAPNAAMLSNALGYTVLP